MEVCVLQPIRFVHFGEELRRRRLAAGLTLTALAQQVHYSKGQLSKVERGVKTPSRQLARQCDVVLGAGGALTSLVQEPPEAEVTFVADGDEEVWLMQLPADGQGWFQPVSRRQVMVAGAVSVPAISLGGQGVWMDADSSTLIGIFRSIFDQYRRLGQTVAPGLVLPGLIANTYALQELSKEAGPRTRQGLLLLASRYAEYVGWLVQETGNEQSALWWTRRAADLAAAGDDHHLAVYGLIRQALITLYRRQAAQTIELSQRAQATDVPPRIRGLAAQREAQGHALAGDYDACMRSLDRARKLLDRDASDSEEPVIGTTNLADPAEMVSGWCLHDLGRPRVAAEIIDRQLARVPHQATRTRVRYGVRSALAHAVAGEVDHACCLTAQLLDDAVMVGSATIADLRSLARTLSRHSGNPSVRELQPGLSTAVRIATI
ncbi:MAG TPA: helix-turn-helix transcriptional regulator [Streptosporangiaceae bacterium]|nr:helix-turn-helix transcriptional regulator [Streptosporangiaceae bacterium]